MTTTKRETALGDGLYLDNRSSTYLWRGRLNGKSKTHRIRHPNGRVASVSDMKKAEARRLAKDIGADAANGGRRFFAVTPAGGVTVEQAWDAYWEREASLLQSRQEKQSHWTHFIKPAWTDRALASITKRDCATLLEERLRKAKVDGEDGTAANNLQKTLKRFFNWCVDAQGYGVTGLEASPMDGLKGKPHATKHTKGKSRGLDRQELVWFFRALERYAANVERFERAASKRRTMEAHEFLLRSMCRSEEVLGASGRGH
jgi:hypothetical protein